MELFNLLSSFGSLIFTLVSFVVALLIIVAVHEYGHYIVGRWTGIYAEVFSLGFGKVLWSRHDKRGTKWQIAAMPFGGYVKFQGDANAASGADSEAIAAMNAEQRRHSMHTAPLWARAATVAAGPVFNFILSILIFAAIIGWRGFAADPLTIADLRPVPIEQGLEVGDEIIAIAGKPTPLLEAFDGYIDSLPEEPELQYDIRRDGQDMTVTGPFPYPPLVTSLSQRSAALDADIEVGDFILEANDTPIATFSQLRTIVGSSDGQPISLEVWRDGEVINTTITPKRADLPLADGGFETRWLIGITGGMAFEPKTASPGPIEAVQYGAQQTYFIIKSSLSGIVHMISGQISTCNMSSPIGIAQATGAAASQGFSSFLWLVAVLSTAIGFMNLLPIPVLDGGHLVFQFYEAIFRRPPNDKAMQVMMSVGLALLLTVMLFAVFKDVTC
ncbi:MAG: RIP metalloprotease RseP [Marinosulfonomonas sp.]